ncbi:M20 family metallopeptidase [Mycolicibacterium neoaurum]|uniref:M20 metallopeptidase family protein n=1 Tax=Mycolicibacterium neoaurum TaxID=1795 RepID=UPI0026726F93|nr:M20 family metallopeptidase [Mycolicibacterium neoaurum]MDO3402683.1 M20 family metallopeptidase [Mycolicibacterium neoaurum]
MTNLQELRRELHAGAEVGLQLPATQAILLRELDGLGLTVHVGAGLSSVIAVLSGTGSKSNGTRPTVLIRSDMDALPVTETTGLSFAAPGDTMHACGHDLHMAALVGAIRNLVARRDELHGDVVFMFQPGEEAWGGAQLMLAEGVLDITGTPVDAALGMHVLSYDLPLGTFAFRSGAVLSGSNIITVDFHGRGGHGSAPHLAADPVPAAAHFVSAVQLALSRGISMFEPVTLTFGILNAGTQHNVIADSAQVGGTLRTFSKDAAGQALRIIDDVAHGVAAANGMVADITIRQDTIPTVSDPAETAIARSVAASVLGEARVRSLSQPYSISEDFCWILDRVPGVFVMVGAGGTQSANPPANHSPRATFDDSILDHIAAFETAWAIERLALLHEERSPIRAPDGHVHG